MEDVVLIKEDTSLDKLVNVVIGSLATITSAVAGGAYLYEVGKENYEFILPLVVVPYTLYRLGQYFFTPPSER
jgi:hypothetical protein